MVGIEAIIQDLLALVKHQLQKDRVSIHTDIADAMPTIRVYP